MLRGTAQNPDVFFQAREAANPFHLAVPGIVEEVMRRAGGAPAGATASSTTTAPPTPSGCRRHGLGAGAVEETVDAARRPRASRSACCGVRLFHPFPAAQLVAALPPTVRSIAVLDRTKEPGAVGEPLYLEVVAALSEAMDVDEPPFARAPRVIGGRYGLSSKEVTPAMIKAVFDELARRRGRSGTSRSASTTTSPHLSLPDRPRVPLPAPGRRGPGRLLRARRRTAPWAPTSRR